MTPKSKIKILIFLLIGISLSSGNTFALDSENYYLNDKDHNLLLMLANPEQREAFKILLQKFNQNNLTEEEEIYFSDMLEQIDLKLSAKSSAAMIT